MTLFDAVPIPPAPDTVELSCRLTGCTRPLAAHVVTQASIENALHPRPAPVKKKRKGKK